MPYLRSAAVCVLLLMTSAVACGGDRSGGPTGDATAIVQAAPDRTVAQGSARVAAAIPTGVATGRIDFGTGKATMTVEPATATQPEFGDPAVAIDVVRAAVSVVPYGGAEVRGSSTIKYELDVAPSDELRARLKRSLRGRTFYADVFVDSQRRIREVAYPIDLNDPRPDQAHRILAKLVTIDFYDFGTAKAG
jgi:hypothetical protein